MKQPDTFSFRLGSDVYHLVGQLWPTACKSGFWWPHRWKLITPADACLRGYRLCLRCAALAADQVGESE